MLPGGGNGGETGNLEFDEWICEEKAAQISGELCLCKHDVCELREVEDYAGRFEQTGCSSADCGSEDGRR